MPSIEQRVADAEESLNEALARVHHAVRNLRELSPGFPSSTPGNGSPGGGKGSVGSTITIDGEQYPTTSVEAPVLEERSIEADPALVALASIDELARRVQGDATDLARLCSMWGYSTAADLSFTGVRRGKATETDTNADRWCVHHAKYGLAEPRGDHKTGARNGLCRWCSDFEKVQEYLPPGAILHMRAEGRRINQATIVAARRVELADAKAVAKRKAAGIAKSTRKRSALAGTVQP